MHAYTARDIKSTLEMFPPTNGELVALALEERKRPPHLGGDRAEVYRILGRFKR